jgi:N-formylglutamate amidohydrolase
MVVVPKPDPGIILFQSSRCVGGVPDATQRADFCIGTDPFHTPTSVRDAIVAAVKEAGYSVTIDAPFAGALVPLTS